MKKHEGKTEFFLSLFIMVFLVLMTMTQLQLKQYRTLKTMVEDALAASCLASAVIDVEEYGISHDLVIGDPDRAHTIYLEALRENMRLDESWEYPGRSLITGPVKVEEYTVYNVRGTDIEVYSRTGGGTRTYTETGGLGRVKAPNGVPVESTSVYSRISFPVGGIFGVNLTAVKEKLADVVNNGQGGEESENP